MHSEETEHTITSPHIRMWVMSYVHNLLLREQKLTSVFPFFSPMDFSGSDSGIVF